MMNSTQSSAVHEGRKPIQLSHQNGSPKIMIRKPLAQTPGQSPMPGTNKDNLLIDLLQQPGLPDSVFSNRAAIVTQRRQDAAKKETWMDKIKKRNDGSQRFNSGRHP